jgi:alanine dehydrogenase
VLILLSRAVGTLFSLQYNIEQELLRADLVIGCALIPGAKTPHLIPREMLKLIRPGTVLVDAAIDQGGCFETSHSTTHTNPVLFVDGILHDCVANNTYTSLCSSEYFNSGIGKCNTALFPQTRRFGLGRGVHNR